MPGSQGSSTSSGASPRPQRLPERPRPRERERRQQRDEEQHGVVLRVHGDGEAARPQPPPAPAPAGGQASRGPQAQHHSERGQREPTRVVGERHVVGRHGQAERGQAGGALAEQRPDRGPQRRHGEHPGDQRRKAQPDLVGAQRQRREQQVEQRRRVLVGGQAIEEGVDPGSGGDQPRVALVGAEAVAHPREPARDREQDRSAQHEEHPPIHRRHAVSGAVSPSGARTYLGRRCHRSSAPPRPGPSGRSRITARSRLSSSARGRPGRRTSGTPPTCARWSTRSPAAAPRTAASARSRATPRPTRRCTR